jgi:hypothetical protein
MPASSPVSMDSHAIAQLRYIRASMDAAGSVPVPGSAGVAVGVVGTLAATLALTPALRAFWLPVWLAAAPLAATAGALVLVRRHPLQQAAWLGAPLRRIALAFFPGLFAGALLTGIEWRSGGLHDIPGTWLLLYGCALLSASALTSRVVAALGALFVLLAVLAFQLPQSAQGVILGLGFGGLHLGFGAYMRRGARGHEA